MTILHAALYTLAGLVLLTVVGNWACRLLFAMTGLQMSQQEADGGRPAGWIIGWLERLVLAAGILARSWELLAAVIALKSVARFQKLDQKRFAEYFLVGSLFSILWSLLVVALWLLYDRRFGSDIWATVAGMIEAPPAAAP